MPSSLLRCCISGCFFAPVHHPGKKNLGGSDAQVAETTSAKVFFCGSGPESHQQVLGFPRNINYKTLFKRSCDDAFSSICDHKAVQLQRDHRACTKLSLQTTVALCHVLLELLESCQRGQFKPLIIIIYLIFFLYLAKVDEASEQKKNKSCKASVITPGVAAIQL